MKKKGIKMVALMLSGALLVGSIVGCDNTNSTEETATTEASSTKETDDTGFLDNTNAGTTKVLKVGDEDIYLNEVNLYALQYGYAYGLTVDTVTGAYSDTQTYDAYHKEQLLTQIREAKIEYIIAQKEGIELTAEQQASIDTGVTNFMKAMDATMLSYFGITEDTVRKVVTEQTYASALEATVEFDGDVDEYQITTIYYLTFLTYEMDENGNLKTDEDGNYVELSADEKANKKELADEALGKIKAGTSIEDIATEYELTNTSGEQSNVYGNFTDEFNTEVEKLSDGEMSEVFESPYGYNIIKMKVKDNKDMAEDLKSYYASSQKSAALKKKQNEWYSSVEINEEDDMYDGIWDSFSFVPFATWFDQLGLNSTEE